MPTSAAYQFVRPFLGRAEASVSFHALQRGTALLFELVLAAVAVAGFVLMRRRRPSAAITFAGLVLAVALVLLFTVAPVLSGLVATTALLMGVCLWAEAMRLIVGLSRRSSVAGA
ncbi:MAG: hypothetical protein ACYS8L_11160 [Planctomycetota bacterium]